MCIEYLQGNTAVYVVAKRDKWLAFVCVPDTICSI